MYRFAERVLLPTVVVLAFAVTSAAGEPPKYVTPPFGTAYTMSFGNDRFAASVPITVDYKAGLAALDNPTIADVALNGVRDPEARLCIEPSFVTPKGATPELRLQTAAGCKVKLHPGAYAVTVEVKPKPVKGKTAAPQSIALQITLPAGELRPPGTQTIELERIWFSGKPRPSSSTLQLFESTSKTPLTNVTIEQIEKFVADEKQVDGTITFDPIAEIPAGHGKQSTATISGSLPQGKAKTTVVVRSPQLAAPVFVAYEVQTRFHPWLVGFAIVVGLIVGLLVRVVLARAISRNGARIAALDVLATITTAQKQSADEEFGVKAAALAATLQAEIDRAADTLPDETKAANAALTALVNSLRTRIEEVTAAIGVLEEQIKAASQSPVAIAIAGSAADLSAVLAKIKDGNATGAKKALNTLTTSLAGRVDTAATAWRDALQKSLDQLSALKPLPSTYAPLIPPEVVTLSGELATMPLAAQSPDLTAILTSVHSVRNAALHGISKRFLDPLADYGESIVKTFASYNKEAAAITDAVGDLRTALAADVSTTLEAPVAAAQKLLDAMHKVILANAPAAMQQKLNELIDAGEYVKAAGASAGGQGVAQGGGSMETAPPKTVIPSTPPLPSGAGAAQVSIVLTGSQIAAARAATWAELIAARVAQSLLISIGLAAVGMLILTPTFDGTWRGLLVAFFWGYAGDITADALTTATKKLP